MSAGYQDEDPRLVESRVEILNTEDDVAAFVAPPAPNLRAQQLVVEVWGTTPNLLVQQAITEVWAISGSVNLRVSELASEAWVINTGSLRVAEMAIEVWTPAPVASLTLHFASPSAPRLGVSSSRSTRTLSMTLPAPSARLSASNHPIFPALLGLAYPVTKELLYGVETQQVASGKVLRLAQWADPVWRYTLKFDFLRQGVQYLEFQAVLGQFLQQLGQLKSFFYDDPDDDTFSRVVFADVINNFTQTQFQLLRGFYDNSGNLIATAPLYVPFNVTIYQGTSSDGTGGTVVDPTTYTLTPWGKVLFASPFNVSGPPGNEWNLAASGSFYQLCRFEDDSEGFDGLWNQFFELRQMKFRTLKPTELGA